MFACPQCQYALVGKVKVNRVNGTATAQIACSHCDAVLHIEITTLREPDKQKLAEKGINASKPATISCLECGAIFNKDQLASHVCPKQ